MELLKGDVRTIYRKYFLAAFGSALISCIYGVVDMAMVGQYQGPDGTAALVSCAAFSVFWTALSLSWPNLYIRIFMRPTAAILTMAPGIVRTYAVSFLLLPLNIFSTYYFQAILKLGAAFFVSVARGLVISGALILLLPAVLGRLRSGGPCRSRSCWSRAMLCRPCGARRGRCRRAKTGPVCIHSCYRG